MFFFHPLKGSNQVSFLILMLWLSPLSLVFASPITEIVTDRQIKETAASSQWHALLHWDGGKHISDQGFLLSLPDFSPEAELYATLNYLYSGDANTQCRFPARYFFLQRRLLLPELDLSKCQQLTEFEERAPIDKLHLVFASENITQPSSMMGHVFLKISGTNSDSIPVEHAISFYAKISGVNLPKIIYDNIISGGQGHFMLAPYEEKLKRYHHIENRNLWEYELDSDSLTRKLIQLHLFELKQTKLTYFFQDYNCATLTQFVLNIVDPKPAHRYTFGTSPVDVVKRAKDSRIIKNITFVPANKWQIRMLVESINEAEKDAIINAVGSNDIEKINAVTDEKDRFVAFELAQSYTNLQLEKNIITAQQNNILQEKIEAGKSQISDFDIDLRNYKDPTKSPADSQISLGSFKYLAEDYLTIGILPAAHKLEDDNRQYFGETELALADLTIASSLKDGSAFINSFSLYSVKSLIPRDTFSGGLSGQFKIGMQQQIAKDWQKHSQFYIEGALGSAFSLGDDISIYGLLGTGIASSRLSTFAAGGPEIGIIIKEVFNMKSMVHARRTFASSNSVQTLDNLIFTQAFYLNSDWAAFIQWENIRQGQQSENQYSFWLKRYF